MGAKQSQPGHSSLRFDSRLLRAVFRNDIETVEYLIAHHSDLNIVEHGHGALNVALHVQNKQVAKLLLDAGKSWEPYVRIFWMNCIKESSGLAPDILKMGVQEPYGTRCIHNY